MLGMFWIALELSNPMAGLITRLTLLLKNLIAFKFSEVAKSCNAELDPEIDQVKMHISKINRMNAFI